VRGHRDRRWDGCFDPSASAYHNRIARRLANELDGGGSTSWNADLDFDVRLRDVPLLNRRPDVVVYRRGALRQMPMRPENVLLVVEVVWPGSETTDRHTKPAEYAQAGIRYYWRIELIENDVPVAYTYILDEASGQYRDAGVFTRVIKTDVPFPVEIDLEAI
jgi:Uma2 family endonuclease